MGTAGTFHRRRHIVRRLWESNHEADDTAGSELTAVLTIDDGFAMGAYTTLYEQGKEIPEDISIIGFGNYHGCQNWFPALTTIEHPVKRMGSLAVEAIDRALRNPSGWLPPRVTIPAELLVRDSTGPVTNQ